MDNFSLLILIGYLNSLVRFVMFIVVDLGHEFGCDSFSKYFVAITGYKQVPPSFIDR